MKCNLPSGALGTKLFIFVLLFFKIIQLFPRSFAFIKTFFYSVFFCYTKYIFHLHYLNYVKYGSIQYIRIKVLKNLN